jgi:D-beta-D-heptose 7-phosphate kinase/D-beta-D-heptose 1-phosphate adenosyltransferase
MTQKPIVLVIGDVMLDVRTEGEMSNISLEAPAPVIRRTSLTESLGGAGNVARNIKSLGHEVLLMGLVGQDSAGATVIKLAAEGGIAACLPVWQKATIVKHRVTCHGQIISRIDVEDTTQCHVDVQALVHGLCGIPQDQLALIRVIVIADYNKGTVTEALMTVVRQFSSIYKVPIFVDARPASMGLYHGVSLLKPNLREALRMLEDVVHPGLADSMDVDTKTVVACAQLAAKYQVPLVLVTNGPHGCHYTDPDDNGRVHVCKTVDHAGNVRDVCGAGDTTMAALAVAAIEGLPFAIAARFAMTAASHVVQQYGVVAADRDSVDQLEYETVGWAAKLMDLPKLLAFVARMRRMRPDAQIVFTNGCFDGFHAGHLETLRFASRQGTCLIVAYNDDQSLIALKGAGRPHVPESFRGSHLAFQECVDAVIRFDGDAVKLIRAIKPDVLVKGADAAPVSRIPGADFMAQHGGRVELCPMDGFTITIDRELPSGKAVS